MGETEQRFEDLYIRKMDGPGKVYIPGTFDYIEKYNKEVFNELVEYEEELEKLWGKDFEEFAEVLTVYCKFLLKCIELKKLGGYI